MSGANRVQRLTTISAPLLPEPQTPGSPVRATAQTVLDEMTGLDEIHNYGQAHGELLLLIVAEVSVDWPPSAATVVRACAIRTSGRRPKRRGRPLPHWTKTGRDACDCRILTGLRGWLICPVDAVASEEPSSVAAAGCVDHLAWLQVATRRAGQPHCACARALPNVLDSHSGQKKGCQPRPFFSGLC
jgi:hypothetical protein